MMLESLSPTKQGGRGRNETVYRYYAGYPPAFIESLLDHLGVTNQELVLDPWNGAGTTTSVCSVRGIPSIGIDANPFMRTVAIIRSMHPTTVLRRTEELQQYLAEAPFGDDVEAPHKAAAAMLRKLEKQGVVRDDDPVACFILGSATRAVFRSIRSSNPTWFSLRRSQSIKSSQADVSRFAVLESKKLENWVKQQSSNVSNVAPVLLTGDARSIWIGRYVDHIISSPPYLTRIDYVQKTLPELLFLDEAYGLDLHALRMSMLGTVLTAHETAGTYSLGDAANAVIATIGAHDSKASKTYYLRFFLAYFEGLFVTLKRLSRLLTEAGTVTLVTQGSYYKEVFVDLPRVVTEMMDILGFLEVDRRGFRAANHMAAINSGTYASKQAAPEEVVSTFRRRT